MDSYEEYVLNFIKEWDRGKESFKLNTSGSTGLPKTISVKRSQMEASAWSTLSYLNISGTTPVTVCIDVRYIGGKMQLVRALTGNLPLQVFTPSADLVSQLLKLPSLGLISLVPLQLYELLKLNYKVLNQATAILIGGGPLQSEVLPKLRQVKTPVYHTYGMTETLSHIALRRMNGERYDDCFTALPGVELSTDNRGCLVIKSNATLNKEVVTNDMVELITDRNFVWKGRWDEVVNSGGIKIFPEDVDKKISRAILETFGECSYFSYGLPDPKLGQKLTLFIETTGAGFDMKTITANLKHQLPRFHAPKEIVLLKCFSRTKSGKVDKRKTAFSVLK